MKKLGILFLLAVAGNLYAQSGIFAGIGPELNANTREGVALGGSLTLGVEINDILAAGAKVTFSSNFDTVTTLEPAGFFRFYFSRHLPLPLGVLFAQAEMGVSVFLENEEAYPAFYGALAAGWRWSVWNGIYLEPLLRFGYPVIWGIGLTAGYRFDMPSGNSD